MSYLATLDRNLPTAEFLRRTEGAIDRELDRWRPAVAGA